MTYTYTIEGSTVIIYDDQGDPVNRIVVTPGDPNLAAYLRTAAPDADDFEEV
jgi:hypothetical protein